MHFVSVRIYRENLIVIALDRNIAKCVITLMTIWLRVSLSCLLITSHQDQTVLSTYFFEIINLCNMASLRSL